MSSDDEWETIPEDLIKTRPIKRFTPKKQKKSAAEKLTTFNLIFAFVWVVLTIPSLLWWKSSILWVIVISLWANIVGHFSAYSAGRSEVAQEKGYNLTELDKKWIQEQLRG